MLSVAHLYVSAATETQDQMEGQLVLDVVVRPSTFIFQLLASKNETPLACWDAFRILSFGLDTLNDVGWVDLQCDGLTIQSVDENVHSTTETEDQK